MICWPTGSSLGQNFLAMALVDQHHAGCAGSVAVSKVAAAQDRNLENIEVAG